MGFKELLQKWGLMKNDQPVEGEEGSVSVEEDGMDPMGTEEESPMDGDQSVAEETEESGAETESVEAETETESEPEVEMPEATSEGTDETNN